MISSSSLFRFINSVILVLFVTSAVLFYNSVHAQQPTPSADDVNAIARQLFCPICENTPLDVCPTDACRDWRELIRQMLAQGKSQIEIKQYFVDHYGARVLSEPPPKGLNLLVYVLPYVAVLIGVYLLFRAFKAWMRLSAVKIKETVPPAAQSPGEVDYASRLEEELRKRK